MPSVLLIDGHVVVREGLKKLLHNEHRDVVIGEAADAAAALRHLGRRSWNLVILDVGLPGQDGFQLLRQIHARHPQASTLVLSTYTEPECAARALGLGAGYVCKSDSRAELLAAIRSALAGRRYLSPALRGRIPALAPARREPPTLSTRERAVLVALAAGQRPVDIAAELRLSVKTISTYRRRLLDKLRLCSTADLIRYSLTHRFS